jgi:hypothetical protein
MDVTGPYAYSRCVQNLEVEVGPSMRACLERVTAAGLAGEIVVVHGIPFQEIPHSIGFSGGLMGLGW